MDPPLSAIKLTETCGISISRYGFYFLLVSLSLSLSLSLSSAPPLLSSPPPLSLDHLSGNPLKRGDTRLQFFKL